MIEKNNSQEGRIFNINSNSAFIFGTNNNESLRILNNGNININNNTSNNYLLNLINNTNYTGINITDNTNTTSNSIIQLNNSNGFGIRSDGMNIYSAGSFTFRNSTLTTTIFSVDSAGNMSFNGTVFPSQGVSTGNNVRGGTVSIGTTVFSGASLTVFSSTQLLPRILLSGQEFFQAATTSTDGIAMLLLVNRLGNRQIGFADSANLLVNATNPILRITPNSVDCLSTNGTRLQTQFGGVLYTVDDNIISIVNNNVIYHIL
jgi:hypothetical protein